MGLTSSSTGAHAVDRGLHIERAAPGDIVVALAGNPNVGKSTVFNGLTGMNQHTGNWPGKTVATAQGSYEQEGVRVVLVDLPGCYSLLAHSAEEEVARDFICFGEPDLTVVVCDATCLERNLNLVLQTMERTRRVVIVVNLMDEANKKHIRVDVAKLSELLHAPVIAASARSGEGLIELKAAIRAKPVKSGAHLISYPTAVERAVNTVEMAIQEHLPPALDARWTALRLLEGEESLLQALTGYLGFSVLKQPGVEEAVTAAWSALTGAGYTRSSFKDGLVSAIYRAAEGISQKTVRFEDAKYNERQLKIDRILTSRVTGVPIMLCLLLVVFFITITGANYPSELLSRGLFWIEDQLTKLFLLCGAPAWLHGALVLGVYRVLAWVVAVMLPPMAIFFPLFTLLEDLGYLPRVAFNLDRHFKKCCACGKQALTMCLGADKDMLRTKKKARVLAGRELSKEFFGDYQGAVPP